MHVVGRHAADADEAGQLVERVVADGVGGLAVVPEFDQDTVPTERVDEAFEFTTRSGRTIGDQRRGDRTLAATGQHPRVAGQSVGEVVERESRSTLLTREMTLADHPGESGVSLGPVGERQQMCSTRVGCVRIGDETGVDLGDGLVFGTGDTTERQARRRRGDHRAP